MLPRISLAAALLTPVALLLAGCQDLAETHRRQAVLAAMDRTADWQLSHPPSAADLQSSAGRLSRGPDNWVQGTFYAGLSALDGLGEGKSYHQALLRIGDANGWKPGSRVYAHTAEPDLYHADDTCVGQMYLEMYLRDRDPRMLAGIKQRLDFILAHPKDDNLAFVGREKNDRWSWCDSLFMGPPTWIRLYAATGDKAYRDYAVDHWWKTSAYLYDPAEHLFYRDSTYFAKREKTGRKVFWSRGNGWVMAGLARLIPYLPKEDPARPRFEQQFREMAARAVQLQQPDGFWRASLLDPGEFPVKETSGTGFFCFALAWGINEGLLPRDAYLPAVLKAWSALTSCVAADGKVTYVQPIGAAPAAVTAESTEPYGTGAFLLAGCEIHRLGGGSAP